MRSQCHQDGSASDYVTKSPNNQLNILELTILLWAFLFASDIVSFSTNQLLAHLIPGNPVLFQSINFLTGSQQKTHSDSIHMTTFPLGGLLGVWIALEDIDETNGALHYYPGSHKLPYYLNSDYDNVGTKWKIGPKDYTHYEKMMEQKIEENKLEKTIFRAKKGDLLIWHANLFHGGEPQADKSKTRKSMVFHYYDDQCICYHEITQRPALMDVK